MEMTYDRTLVMPNGYTELSDEEMTYIDGGGTLTLKIGSNSFVITALSVLGGNLTRATATAALDAIGLSIASAFELGTAGTGTLFVGAFIVAWGGVAATIAGVAATYGVNYLKGKTFAVSNKYFPTATVTI